MSDGTKTISIKLRCKKDGTNGSNSSSTNEVTKKLINGNVCGYQRTSSTPVSKLGLRYQCLLRNHQARYIEDLRAGLESNTFADDGILNCADISNNNIYDDGCYLKYSPETFDSSNSSNVSSQTSFDAQNLVPPLNPPNMINEMNSSSCSSENDSRNDTETWISLTGSLKRFYETQMEVLQKSINDLSEHNDQLESELNVANDEISKQREKITKNLELANIRDAIMLRHKEIIQQCKFALDKLFTQIQETDSNTKSLNNKITDLVSKVQILSDNSNRRASEFDAQMAKDTEEFQRMVVDYKKSSKDYGKQQSLALAHEETVKHYKGLLQGKDEEIQSLTKQIEQLSSEKLKVEMDKEQNSLDFENQINILEDRYSKLNVKGKRLSRAYKKKIKQLENELLAMGNKFKMEPTSQQAKFIEEENKRIQEEIEKAAKELEIKFHMCVNGNESHSQEQRHFMNPEEWRNCKRQ